MQVAHRTGEMPPNPALQRARRKRRAAEFDR